MQNIHYLIKIADLIAQKICNRINEKEKSKLNSWIKESNRNENLINRISNWDNFQERNRVYNSINTDKAWNLFFQKINKPKPRIIPLSVFKYVAAIAIPIILCISTYYYLHNKQETVTEQIASISPGTQNAIIILNNGNKINLKELQLNQLIEKDGSVISNNNGELNYTKIQDKKYKEQLINTLIVPRGGEYNLVLSDSSRVYINSASKLIYPVLFNNEKREVTLEGEAYFEIHRNEDKPFIVNINGMKIEVLGTSFNIKAYQDENKVFTTLLEGKIRLNTDADNDEWILAPNQQAVLTKESNNITIREVDAEQYIGWKNGIYYFTNQSLEEIMRTLSRWYDFEYEFENDALRKIHFEGGLNKYDNINPILEIMQSTGKVKIKIEGNKISLM